MFDSELLKPMNHCSYTGLERFKRHNFGRSVRIFECTNSQRVRVIVCDTSGAIAGLMVNPHGRKRTYTIEAVYTEPNHRRKGLARQLLAVARLTLGTVQHNENLTIDGKAWRNSVEGFKNDVK